MQSLMFRRLIDLFGSKRSDSMNSYFERNTSQRANVLNPEADMFVPVTLDEKMTDVPVILQPQVVRPKQSRKHKGMRCLWVLVKANQFNLHQLLIKIKEDR